jgi:hypothetical protein
MKKSMSRKRVDYEHETVDVRFSNWLAQLVMFIQAKFTYLVVGRGGTKTTQMSARMLQEVSYDMPGCQIAISGDTYMNLRKNVIPSLVQGWKFNGWIEDVHFVLDKRPPSHFKNPYKPPLEWKNTITDLNGTHYKFISQDRPQSGAGDSYQYVYVDETKAQSEKKLSKLTPALRGGDVEFMKSPFYGGRLYTTDMPNPNHGEHDFILDLEKNMDHKRMIKIFQAAEVINDIKIDKYKATVAGDKKAEHLADKNLERWTDSWKWLRKNSTFYYCASSYVAADTLPQDYFKDAFENENMRDVMVSLLSMKVKLDKGQLFYPTFNPKKHLYSNGFDYTRYDAFDFATAEWEEQSIDLRYCNPDLPIEAGFDSGTMCSFITGQSQGNIQRLLKFLYTIPDSDHEGFIKGLGKQFRDYYQHHRNKQLYIWEDPATKKYRDVGDDHAGRLKQAIEYDEHGNSTGWFVSLMNQEQGSISQQAEFDLMYEIFEGKNPALPKVKMDANTCKALKASIEMAERIEKVNTKGQKTTHKLKTSEKTKDPQKLLMKSTNPSDSMKYYFCRKDYLEVISSKKSGFVYIPN